MSPLEATGQSRRFYRLHRHEEHARFVFLHPRGAYFILGEGGEQVKKVKMTGRLKYHIGSVLYCFHLNLDLQIITLKFLNNFLLCCFLDFNILFLFSGPQEELDLLLDGSTRFFSALCQRSERQHQLGTYPTILSRTWLLFFFFFFSWLSSGVNVRVVHPFLTSA